MILQINIENVQENGYAGDKAIIYIQSALEKPSVTLMLDGQTIKMTEKAIYRALRNYFDEVMEKNNGEKQDANY